MLLLRSECYYYAMSKFRHSIGMIRGGTILSLLDLGAFLPLSNGDFKIVLIHVGLPDYLTCNPFQSFLEGKLNC